MSRVKSGEQSGTDSVNSNPASDRASRSNNSRTHASQKFILASASPRRRDLLAQIHLVPDVIIPADIDETPARGELPRPHAFRLASEKCHHVFAGHAQSVVLAADTVVGVGRRILPKTEDEASARQCLEILSGRAHRVYTGICVMSGDMTLSRVVETRLTMKRLSRQEVEDYIKSGEWQGKAGGYGIQGYAGAFISKLNGSYTNVVGLPLFETRHLLMGAGLLGHGPAS